MPQRQLFFFSGKTIMNKFFGNHTKLNSNSNINNLTDIATVKMEIYRTKLFKEFFKHFKKYYQNYIKIYYYYFLNKLKNEKKFTVNNAYTFYLISKNSLELYKNLPKYFYQQKHFSLEEFGFWTCSLEKYKHCI